MVSSSMLELKKTVSPEEHNPTGLYLSMLRETIKRLDGFGVEKDEEILVIMNEYVSRSDILTVAAQEMYEPNQRRKLIEPFSRWKVTGIKPVSAQIGCAVS
jgi:mannose-1-phosphate guanylyltransferase